MATRTLSRMNEDPDIWFRANLLMRQFGSDAAAQAATRLGETLNSGDMDGAAVWRRVALAIGQLQTEALALPSN